MKNFIKATAIAREIKGVLYFNNSYGNFFALQSPIYHTGIEMVADFTNT